MPSGGASGHTGGRVAKKFVKPPCWSQGPNRPAVRLNLVTASSLLETLSRLCTNRGGCASQGFTAIPRRWSRRVSPCLPEEVGAIWPYCRIRHEIVVSHARADAIRPVHLMVRYVGVRLHRRIAGFVSEPAQYFAPVSKDQRSSHLAVHKGFRNEGSTSPGLTQDAPQAGADSRRQPNASIPRQHLVDPRLPGQSDKTGSGIPRVHGWE